MGLLFFFYADVCNQKTKWGLKSGCRYALETLLQLAAPKAQLDCGGGFSVQDMPVYKHRGLMLDTARRFFPMPLLLATIDAMAIFKLNVLHLHLNDGNSVHRFRVESKAFPQLTQPQNCTTCGFYTQDEIKSLVQYAHLRGVRVIPEFELLSHATSICGQCCRSTRVRSTWTAPRL